MSHKKITLFIDGASRGNPGPAGIGVLLLDKDGNKVKDFCKYIGKTTNNVAEYTALIYGLDEALMFKASEVEINLDSELVVKQMRGEYRVRDDGMKALFDKAVHILRGFDSYKINHIDRTRNKEADKLANKAINLADLTKKGS